MRRMRTGWALALGVALLAAGCGPAQPGGQRAEGTPRPEFAPVVYEDAPGPQDPDEAVRWYVAAQFTRDTPILRLVTTPRLQQELGMDQYPPSFGVSSPWVDRAEVLERREEDGRVVYRVRFGLATSTGPAGMWEGEVTVVRHDGRYLVDAVRER